jgi:hypothetical protein
MATLQVYAAHQVRASIQERLQHIPSLTPQSSDDKPLRLPPFTTFCGLRKGYAAFLQLNSDVVPHTPNGFWKLESSE